ncbi:MAG: hypothetical protein PVH61_22060 [Candidatus Aminicenantes bacterium]|jgi:hypothetical protein
MKVKIMLFLTCWGLLTLLSLQAKKVAVFDEFGQPASINVGNGFIYVQEKTNIFVYKLENYQFVTKFGKEGEGPGELKINPIGAPMAVDPANGKVYITSLGKLSVFSKTGEYIKEYKVSANDNFYAFGSKFVCLSTAPKDKNAQEIVLALFLADENLKKDKLIYKSDFEVGANFNWDFPISPFYPDADGDKLFVIAGVRGFAIDVFDQNGEKLYSIERDYKRIKIPSSYKDKTLKWFRKTPNYRELYEFFKARISFKDYYPPIYLMFADNGLLYVLTNKLDKDQRECIVTDHKGNEKKRIYLPVPENYGLDYSAHYTIKDNYFYKLEENIDEETWELVRIKV